MKAKTILIASISLFCCVLLLAAFTVIPRVRLSNGNNSHIDLSYLDVIFEEDSITLRANYKGYGENFEIAKDIKVATDSEFTNQLRLTGCSVEQDTGIYIYKFALEGYKEKIYVKPPILYVPITTAIASAAVDSGSTVYTADGNEWFTITSVKVDKYSDDFYTVSVMITPLQDTKLLPRFPMLVCGDNRLGGASATNFNQDDVFEFGEFVFFVEASSIEEISSLIAGASIEINQALEMVSVESNARVLSVRTK